MEKNIMEDIFTLGLMLTYYKGRGFERETAISSCAYSSRYIIQRTKPENIYTEYFRFPYAKSANLDRDSR